MWKAFSLFQHTLHLASFWNTNVSAMGKIWWCLAFSRLCQCMLKLISCWKAMSIGLLVLYLAWLRSYKRLQEQPVTCPFPMNIPNSCKQLNRSTSIIWLTMLNSALNSRKIQQLHLVIIYESSCIHKKLKVMWKKLFLMSLSYFRYLLCKCMFMCSLEEL